MDIGEPYSFNISQEFSMDTKQISYVVSKIQLAEKKNYWTNSKKNNLPKLEKNFPENTVLMNTFKFQGF